MTDIPQVYFDEAVRRLNEAWDRPHYYKASETHFREVQCLARTLQELGWQPPVDPMLVRAREIAAQVWLVRKEWDSAEHAQECRDGQRDDTVPVQAALIALREGMGK